MILKRFGIGVVLPIPLSTYEWDVHVTLKGKFEYGRRVV
jgi:hypothetical protein